MQDTGGAERCDDDAEDHRHDEAHLTCVFSMTSPNATVDKRSQTLPHSVWRPPVPRSATTFRHQLAGTVLAGDQELLAERTPWR
jgi:hypothetical protein